jgi:hypothetical protein
MIKSLKVLAEFALVAMLVACGGSEKGGPPAAGPGGNAGSPGSNAASKASDEIPTKDRKEMYLDRYRFGIAADADGIVVKESDWIPPGSTVVISLYLRNAPTGSELRIVWNDLASKTSVGDDIIKPVGDKGLVTFKQASPLPNGSYRAELYFRQPEAKEWRDLGGHDFKVGTKS